jgi:hypothetical protein
MRFQLGIFVPGGGPQEAQKMLIIDGFMIDLRFTKKTEKHEIVGAYAGRASFG